MFKLKTKIRRLVVDWFKLNRPTSYPFITGDGFRSLAQHMYDENSNLKPELVEENDIVFVRSDFLKEYFKIKHILIKNKYILISHGGDANITEKYNKYVDDNIICWFTQHLMTDHPKIKPLATGLADYHYSITDNRGKLSVLRDNIKKIGEKIKYKISFGFSYTHPDRIILEKKLLKNNKYKKIESTDQSKFLNKISQYNFTISPEGNAIDCYRTWEAMYLKTVPIIKRSVATTYYEKIGLPVLVVDSWDEIDKMSNEFLDNKYKELEPKFLSPALFIDYWADLIIKEIDKNQSFK